MKELSIELDNNTIPFKELQCIIGAYFQPYTIEHRNWQSIADEIAQNFSHRCIKRVIRQIDILLANPAIDDTRLVTWVKRYSITWTCSKDSDARTELIALRTHLAHAVHSHQRSSPLDTLSRTASYA